MIRRPAVTLIEVLVAMFIMAIGMLALLVLFPLGAISMGQALKDDRCASAAAMAANLAIARDLRHDATVLNTFTASAGNPVYVDPYGSAQGLTTLGASPPSSIQRIAPSFISAALPVGAGPSMATDRWFSLPDDITFLENGQANPFAVAGGGTNIERGRRYTFAYLLRPLSSDDLVEMAVVVYSGRPINALSAVEDTYSVAAMTLAAGSYGSNGLTLTNVGPVPPNIKRGSWILDTTPVTPGPSTGQNYFYRVVNTPSVYGGTMVLEVQPNLKAVNGITSIAVMDSVAEVFEKGTGL
jgi:hypothetical protein